MHQSQAVLKHKETNIRVTRSHVTTGYYLAVCPAGELAYPDGTKCEKCPQAMYKPNPGDGVCTPCPSERYTATTGSTGASDCSEFYFV